MKIELIILYALAVLVNNSSARKSQGVENSKNPLQMMVSIFHLRSKL